MMKRTLGKLFGRGGYARKILEPQVNTYRYNSYIYTRLLYVSSRNPNGLSTNFSSSKSLPHLQQSPWTHFGGWSIS